MDALHEVQIPPPIGTTNPWDRQANESARWFLRFRRFLKMGTRRAVNAVYQQEQQEKAEESRSRGKAGETWYTAARRYQWASRAEAWDTSQEVHHAAQMRTIAQQCAFVSRPYRITQLDLLAETLSHTLEKPHTPALYVVVCKQLQSIMADIRLEVAAWDVPLETACDAAALEMLKVKSARAAEEIKREAYLAKMAEKYGQ